MIFDGVDDYILLYQLLTCLQTNFTYCFFRQNGMLFNEWSKIL